MNNNTYTTPYHTNAVDNILIWLIALCSLKFYTFLIPMIVAKSLALLGVVLVLGLIIIHLVYGNGLVIRKRFRIETVMIFIALIISVFAAKFFHEQSISLTLFSQYEFYLFLFYFLLHKMRPDPDKLMNMFIWLGYIYAFIYFLQYVAYPAQIVTSKTIFDRGTVRVLMPGTEYMVATWFILLSRYFRTKKIINIIGLLPFIIILIFLAVRQLIAATALLTLLNILLSKTLKSKVLVAFLIVLTIIPFYFLFQGIFDQLLEVSHKETSASLQNNVRFLAAKYFLFDHNHNPLWILTGNGMPDQKSAYGKFLWQLSEKLGYYMSDVGIIGDFSKFGILFALAEISFLAKLSLYRCREKYSFIRYSALMSIMTLFTGAGLGASGIVKMCFLFYIMDADKHSA
ncbi:MAG: hypothetical protein JW973_12820 [Bacteroidales bacterium]|nr:hypothetical protein [Bacteroidales bacterium]